MKKSLVPLNLMILDTQSPEFKRLRSVESLDLYEGATRQLHPKGLFSTEIFGRIGDPLRDRIFAKIDLSQPAFDPTCFDIICSLKALYKEIAYGRKFATFDEDIQDFVLADPLTGDTGYSFFMKHWKKIDFAKNDSDRRNTKIDALNRYRDKAEIHGVAVLPAGLRDIEVNEGGRSEENEVNDLYRKVLSAARVINAGGTGNERALDNARASLQRAVQEIWAHFVTLVSGKKGYIQGRFAGRRIFNGTRNVITAMETTPARLGDPGNIKMTDCQVGIFQTAKGLLPVTIGCMRRHLLKYNFSEAPGATMANLTDPSNLKTVQVTVPYAVKDQWVTKDGLAKVIESYRDDGLRFKPIVIEGHYLGLIYEGADMTFKMFQSIEELPEGFDRARVRPINLTDLIYLLSYADWSTRYILPTRYPATGPESIYPCTLRLTSTVPEEIRRELNDEWQIDEDSVTVGSYPIRSAGSFFDSMAVHPSRLGGMAADHDGDMTSGNYLYSDEAIVELDRIINDANFYLDAKGSLRASASVYTVDLVSHNMTGE